MRFADPPDCPPIDSLRRPVVRYRNSISDPSVGLAVVLPAIPAVCGTVRPPMHFGRAVAAGRRSDCHLAPLVGHPIRFLARHSNCRRTGFGFRSPGDFDSDRFGWRLSRRRIDFVILRRTGCHCWLVASPPRTGQPDWSCCLTDFPNQFHQNPRSCLSHLCFGFQNYPGKIANHRCLDLRYLCQPSLTRFPDRRFWNRRCRILNFRSRFYQSRCWNFRRSRRWFLNLFPVLVFLQILRVVVALVYLPGFARFCCPVFWFDRRGFAAGFCRAVDRIVVVVVVVVVVPTWDRAGDGQREVFGSGNIGIRLTTLRGSPIVAGGGKKDGLMASFQTQLCRFEQIPGRYTLVIVTGLEFQVCIDQSATRTVKVQADR